MDEANIKLKTKLVSDLPYTSYMSSLIVFDNRMRKLPYEKYRNLVNEEKNFIIPEDFVRIPNNKHPWASYMEMLTQNLIDTLKKTGYCQVYDSEHFYKHFINLRARELLARWQHKTDIESIVEDDIVDLRTKAINTASIMPYKFVRNWRHLFDQELACIETNIDSIKKLENTLSSKDEDCDEISKAIDHLNMLIEQKRKSIDARRLLLNDEIQIHMASKTHHISIAKSLIDMGTLINVSD
jgi:hypothetical protein